MSTTATLPRGPRKAKAPKPPSKYLDDPEVVLMLRVQGGDDGAFAELVQRYRARVFGSFVKRLGDRQEAEDLTQEVFCGCTARGSATSRAPASPPGCSTCHRTWPATRCARGGAGRRCAWRC
jgi:hypothetical protein